MTVQDAVSTVHVPQQARTADPPPVVPPAAAAAVAPLLGRDRPLTADEREFVVTLAVLLLALEVFIVTGLLLAQFVWG